MKIKRAYHENIFKGWKLEYKGHTGHLALGRNEYTLFIHGDFVCQERYFKDIKQRASEEFIKRYGE